MTKVFVIRKDEISFTGSESFSHQTRKVALDKETIHHGNIPTILITDYDQKNEANHEESNNENISVIARIDNFVIEVNNNFTDNSVKDNWEDSLEKEEHSNERKSRKRTEAFKSIILDKPKVFAWTTLAYYTIGIALIGVLVTTPLTVIPAHDIIQFPEYWYEIFFHGAIGITSEIVRMSFVFGNTLNTTFTQKTRNVLFICISGNVTMFLFLSLTYYIWVQILNYQYPIPLHGILATHLLFMVNYTTIWLRFPSRWRQNPKFRQRMKSLTKLSLFATACQWFNLIISAVIKKSNDHYQPFVALALPTMRELNIWVSNKIAKQCSNGDVRKTTIVVTYAIYARYTISVCSLIGLSTTDVTSWVLIGLDFLINIWTCLKIVFLKKRNNEKIEEQINLIQDLAIFELVEFQAPLSLILIFMLAYFGPNGHLFGNILNSYWAYGAIDNVENTFRKMTIFFAVDFSSTITSIILLWVFCRINFLKALMELQKEFSKLFSVILGTFSILVG